MKVKDIRQIKLWIALLLGFLAATPLISSAWVLPGVTWGIDASGISSLPITPTMYNPYAPNNVMFMGWGGYWFIEPLAYFDSFNGSLFPDIAQSWSYNPNNLTLIIHIRPGLTWFNGKYTIPLTAKDVWSDLLIDNYIFSYWSIYVSEILMVSNDTVMVIYSKPWTMGLYSILTTPPHLPYFVVQNYTQLVYSTLLKYNWNSSAPAVRNLTALATKVEAIQLKVDWVDGPFWIDPSTVTNVGFVAYKNPYFWNAKNVWYPAANFVIETGNRQQALSYQEQGVMVFGWPGYPISMLQAANSTGKILVTMTPDLGGYGVALKFTKPFDNPLVREAFAYLINASEVANTYPPVYQAPSVVGSPAISGFIPWVTYELPQGTVPLLRNYTYNVTEGFALLREAGWKQVNGQWYFPNGSPATIIIQVPAAWTDWVAMTEDVAGQLKAEGFNAQAVTVDVNTFWGTIEPNGLYEAISQWFGGWQPTISLAAWSVGSYNMFVYSPQWGQVYFNQSWPVPLTNGTTIYVNLTKIQVILNTQPIFSQQWNESVKEFAWWYNYYLPVIPLAWKIINMMWYTPAINMTIFNDLIGKPTGYTYGFPYYGNVLKQDNILRNVGLEFFIFGNIRPPDANIPALQSVQFPYPPNVTALLKTQPPFVVSTSTTTSVSTSTSVSTTTTTVTTTSAVTSVTTVTKGPSAALIAAIIVVIIVVVAVVAYLALRRR